MKEKHYMTKKKQLLSIRKYLCAETELFQTYKYIYFLLLFFVMKTTYFITQECCFVHLPKFFVSFTYVANLLQERHNILFYILSLDNEVDTNYSFLLEKKNHEFSLLIFPKYFTTKFF